MNLLEIEIVKPNDKFVKLENEHKYELDYDEFAAVDTVMDDHYTAKCGEILVSNSGKYSFSCMFCDARFQEIEIFIDHMKKEHLNVEAGQKDPLFDEEGQADVPIKSEVASIDDSDSVDSAKDVGESKEQKVGPINESDFMKEFRAFKDKTCNEDKEVVSLEDDAEPELLKQEEKARNPEWYCEICDRQYNTQRGFQRHKTRHLSYETDDNFGEKSEPRTVNFLKCRFCNRQFRDKSRRISHERIHTGEKPFECEHCEKKFRTKRLLGHHVMTHLGIKPHQCPYCEAAFTHKMNLVVHIRAHKGDKRYKCDYCDKGFIRNVDRRIHMRTHTGEKPYQCEWCGNSFSTSSKLTEHRKRHTNTKPYKCEDCGKCFYSGNLLKNHAVVHSNERPFECQLCLMTFPRKRALQSHVKIHSDVKEYVCTICDKAFAQNAGLYCHMKSHGVRVTKKLPPELDEISQGI